ncbi:MAG: hypothetical protein MK098_11845 [Marinovum sp.]|nr:hypothetical protein [Marinovum sp.]
MSFESIHSGGSVLRVFDYEAGATGAINLDSTDASRAIEAFEHPENKNFLKEQSIIMIDGNHLYTCGLGNKDGTFAANVLDIAAKSEVLSQDVRMQVADVPNQMEIERVNSTGVKKVEFALNNYFEKLKLAPRQPAGLRVLKKLFGEKVDAEETQRRAEMLGRVVLKRNRFRRDEVQKDQWLTEVGEEILTAGSADDFLIVLEDNSKIRADQLQRTKQVKINKHANTFSYSHAVMELSQFRLDCLQDGSLGV